MVKNGWTSCIVGAILFFIGVYMLGEGYNLLNSTIHGEITLRFLHFNIADGVTQQNVGNYADGFLMYSIFPLIISVFCYIYFLKSIPVQNKSL